MTQKLTSITLRGFKTISDLTNFALNDLTVLIGPNGAGKSNFISFFRLLSWALASPGQPQLHVAQQGGANALLHDGAAVTPRMEVVLSLESDAGTNEYGFVLAYAAADTLLFTDEWYRYQPFGERRTPFNFGAGHRESQLLNNESSTAKYIRGALRRIIVHQFHNTSPTARIRSRWDASDNRWLKEDGGNLAPFLYRIHDETPGYFQLIEDTLRLILPFFAGFELYPESDKLLLRWREIGSDQVFNASQASDGMLRVMALVALLQQPERDLPILLILDEPELGLHPYAIEVLASLIRSASKHVQVVVATQSVSLLDRFDPDDIVVVTRTGRQSLFRRLQSAELDEWLQSYTLSELWEKNVVGGRPTS